MHHVFAQDGFYLVQFRSRHTRVVAAQDVDLGRGDTVRFQLPFYDPQVLEIVADERVPAPPEMLQNDDVMANLGVWLDQLDTKQREVLVRRFGLNNHERTTLEDVGKELGVTRERVRQIQMDALKQLRKILENQGFTEELLFQD